MPIGVVTLVNLMLNYTLIIPYIVVLSYIPVLSLLNTKNWLYFAIDYLNVFILIIMPTKLSIGVLF